MPFDPRSTYPSLTPTAVQIRWKTPTEFPECPQQVSDAGLEEYASRLSFGTQFSQTEYGSSWVVERDLKDNSLVVLTHLGEDAMKQWAVTHVSISDGFFCHRNEHTFHTLRGALKHFCALAGIALDDSMDDYC